MNNTQKIEHLMEHPQPDQQHGFALKLMEMLVVPTFVIDTSCKVLIWNKACERLTGVPAYEVLGTTEHWRSFYSEQRPTLADLLIQGRTGELHSLYQQHARRNDPGDNLCAENWCDMPRLGRRRYLAADASPIFDATGKVVAVVETLRDVTDEKKAQVALERLATRDALTGLANRRCFEDQLEREWRRASRDNKPLAVALLELDQFRLYADKVGQDAADDTLRQVAQALNACVQRAGDLVARYGAAQFAFLAPATSGDDALRMAHRMAAAVARLAVSGGSLTLSVGVAANLAEKDCCAEDLVLAADQALYRAKAEGGKRSILAEEEAAA